MSDAAPRCTRCPPGYWLAGTALRGIRRTNASSVFRGCSDWNAAEWFTFPLGDCNHSPNLTVTLLIKQDPATMDSDVQFDTVDPVDAGRASESPIRVFDRSGE